MRVPCTAAALVAGVSAIALVTACRREIQVVERTTTVVAPRDAARPVEPDLPVRTPEPPAARTVGDERRAN
jgi:hypothetical protein